MSGEYTELGCQDFFSEMQICIRQSNILHIAVKSCPLLRGGSEWGHATPGKFEKNDAI